MNKNKINDELLIFENIFEYSYTLIAYMDRDFNFLKVNRQYALADNKIPDFFVGKNHFELYPDEENESIFRHVVKTGKPHLDYEKPFEYPEHPEKGTTYWDWCLIPVKDDDGNVTHLILNLLDVTEKVLSRKAYEEERKRLKLLINATPDIICFKDGYGRWLEANDAALKLFDLENTNYKYKTDLDIAKVKPQFRDIFEEFMKSDENVWNSKKIMRNDETITDKFGNRKVFDVIRVPLINDDGSRRGIIVLGRDITGKKEAEEQLQINEEKYRRIFENIQDVYFKSSIDGNLLDISPSVKNYTNIPVNRLIGLDLRSIYKDKNQGKNLVKELLHKGEINDYEIELVNEKEEMFNVSISAYISKNNEDENIFIEGVLRDISERKKLERQLLHANKMESVGRLASGIAHDFNNILSSIFFNVEFGLQKLDDPKIVEKTLRSILSAGESASKIVKQLHVFTKRKESKPEQVDVNQSIEEVLGMFERIIGKDCEIVCRFQQDLPLILCDKTQLEQVITNLVLNARDAVEDRSDSEDNKIIIETEKINLDKMSADFLLEFTPGDFICIKISDTGIGISQKDINKIFDPFYSTKSEDRGTGLGLSMVYGIIKQYGGTLRVKSSPGKGTNFYIYFPSEKC